MLHEMRPKLTVGNVTKTLFEYMVKNCVHNIWLIYTVCSVLIQLWLASNKRKCNISIKNFLSELPQQVLNGLRLTILWA